MNNDKTQSSPILEAKGTVVDIAQSLLNNSTIYHLALKIFDKQVDNAFEIITLTGVNITELPLLEVSDKVSIQYLSRPVTTCFDGVSRTVGRTNELLTVSIDWQSAYRRTFKYGDYS